MNFEKDLIVLISVTIGYLKSRYRNTIYGFIWVVLNPILIYLVQVFVFKMIFKGNFPHYELYLMAGLIPWLFIVQSVDMCTGIFLHSGHILKNLPINPLTLPISQMIENFINFISAFLILCLYFLFFDSLKLSVLLQLIFPVFLLFISVTSFSIVFAVLNIRFRDIKFVLSFMFSGLFFMTPIFYSIEIVTGNIKTIMQLNPFYILIKPFQEMLIYGPSILYYKLLISSVAITLLFVTGATFVWHKMKRNISLYG